MNRKNLISPPDADVPHVRAPVHPRAGLRRQMWGQDRLQASQVKVAAHQTASPQAARILPVQVLHDAPVQRPSLIIQKNQGKNTLRAEKTQPNFFQYYFAK